MFLMYAFMAIYFPLSSALAVAYKFFFMFLFHLKNGFLVSKKKNYILVSLVIFFFDAFII